MAIHIQAAIKRGFISEVAEAAKARALTLREAILAARKNIYSPSFQKGKIVVSQSGSGQSGSYEIGVSGKQFTQENVFGMLQLSLEVLEETVSASLPDDADPTHTDALLAAMFQDQFFQEITEQMGDFSILNFPPMSSSGGAV